MRADPNSYDNDVMAWANEQARLLRAGCLDALDIEHIADEIEDVGKSEQRELASRMAVLAGPSAQVAAATATARRQLGNHRPDSAQSDYVTPEAGPQSEGETKRCRMVGRRLG